MSGRGEPKTQTKIRTMVARNGDHTYAKTDRVRYSPACAHISYLQPYYTSRTVDYVKLLNMER